MALTGNPRDIPLQRVDLNGVSGEDDDGLLLVIRLLVRTDGYHVVGAIVQDGETGVNRPR